MTITDQDHRPTRRSRRSQRLTAVTALGLLLGATAVLVVARQSPSDDDERRQHAATNVVQTDTSAGTGDAAPAASGSQSDALSGSHVSGGAATPAVPATANGARGVTDSADAGRLVPAPAAPAALPSIPVGGLPVVATAPTRAVDVDGPTIDARFDRASIQDVPPGGTTCPGHEDAATRSRLLVHVDDPSGLSTVTQVFTLYGRTFGHPLAPLGDGRYEGELFGAFGISDVRGPWIFGVTIEATDTLGHSSRALAMVTVHPCR